MPLHRLSEYRRGDSRCSEEAKFSQVMNEGDTSPLEVGSQYVVRFRSTQISPGPSFQRGVMLWDSEELRDAAKRFPPLKRGIKGDFYPTPARVIGYKMCSEEIRTDAVHRFKN